jgi:SAM-dependent methyltransferase
MNNPWNKIYKSGKQHSVYPWSNLVSLIKKNFKTNSNHVPILEIGCGYGANIQFLLDNGFDYYGVDISNFAIQKLKKKFPLLKEKLFALDFSKTKINSNIKFELIIDRGSGTHCTTEQFKDFLKIYKNNFHKNIRYFALDWFSNKHSESKNSQKLDKNTRTNFKYGQFKDCGSVHFSTKNHIQNFLFKDWNCVYFVENLSINRMKENYKVGTFDFIMRKK